MAAETQIDFSSIGGKPVVPQQSSGRVDFSSIGGTPVTAGPSPYHSKTQLTSPSGQPVEADTPQQAGALVKQGYKVGPPDQQNIGKPDQPGLAERIFRFITTPLASGKKFLNQDTTGFAPPLNADEMPEQRDYYQELRDAANKRYSQGKVKGVYGMLPDAADVFASSTSPLALASGPASVVAGGSGPAAVAARTALRGAGVTFGVQGAKDVHEAVADSSQPMPDRVQKGLTGASMVAGGLAGVDDLRAPLTRRLAETGNAVLSDVANETLAQRIRVSKPNSLTPQEALTKVLADNHDPHSIAQLHQSASAALDRIQSAATSMGLPISSADDALSAIKQAKVDLLREHQDALAPGQTVADMGPAQRAGLDADMSALNDIQKRIVEKQAAEEASQTKGGKPGLTKSEAAKKIATGFGKAVIGRVGSKVSPFGGTITRAAINAAGLTSGFSDISAGIRGLSAPATHLDETLQGIFARTAPDLAGGTAQRAVDAASAPAGADPFATAGSQSVDRSVIPSGASVYPPEQAGGDLREINIGSTRGRKSLADRAGITAGRPDVKMPEPMAPATERAANLAQNGLPQARPIKTATGRLPFDMRGALATATPEQTVAAIQREVNSFVQQNPNATPGEAKAFALNLMDAHDLGGLADSFAPTGTNNPLVAPKRRAGALFNSGVSSGIPEAVSGNVTPDPNFRFSRTAINGETAALEQVASEPLHRLKGIANARGIQFDGSLPESDLRNSLIHSIVSDMVLKDDPALAEFAAQAAERSRFSPLYGKHPSTTPTIDFPGTGAPQPRSVMGMITGRADEPAPQVPTDDNTAELLQRSIEQANAKKAGAAATPEKTPLQTIFGGQQPPERRSLGRIDPFSTQGIRISTLRGEMANATNPAERQAFQDAINREIALARGENPPLTQQAEAENLPQTQPRTVEPSEQFPPKPAPPVSAANLKPGQSGNVPLSDLSVDAKRFQFKTGTDEHGETNLLKDTKSFNPDLAGVVSVWTDPVDGKTYIVNGHHRFGLARRTGQQNLLVRKLDVPTAEAARARGALINISEGRGTAVDAAKFFRDSGLGPQDLERAGVSLAEGKVQSGLALGNLDPSIFEQVATGKMSEGRGVAIGEQTNDPAEQEAIVKLIARAENRGKTVTNATVSELARFVKNSSRRVEQNADLFGPRADVYSNAVEKAEISAYVKQQLAREKRVFGAVADQKKAATLGAVEGQQIKPGENAKISQAAAQQLEVFDKLSSYKGPVDEILENAAKELNAGYDKPEVVKQKAFQRIRDEVQKAVPGGEGGGNPGHDSGTASGKGPQAKTQKSVRPFFGDLGGENA